MKSAFQYKFERFHLLKQKNDILKHIDDQEKLLKDYTNHEIKISNARVYYAATKLNAIVRGFLDRVLCRKLRKHQRAINLIQKVMKGKLGRMRWRKEYWRSLSIVKSDHALKEIIERSTLIRDKILRKGRQKDHWKELYDPLTDSFWYFNQVTKQNTWEVPVCFQQSLICHWNGYDEAGGISSALTVDSKSFVQHLQQSNYTSLPHVPCRCVFTSIGEYYSHLRTKHTWYCVACYNKNPGVIFPVCALCGNKYNEQGVNEETVVQQNISKVQEQLNEFIEKDIKGSLNEYQTMPYHIRERLIELATERKETLEKINEIMYETMKENERQKALLAASNPINSMISPDDSSVESATSNQKREELQDVKNKYKRKMSMAFSQKRERATFITNKISNEMFANKVNDENDEETGFKLPPIPGAGGAGGEERQIILRKDKLKQEARRKEKLKKSLTRTGSIANLAAPYRTAFARFASADELENDDQTDNGLGKDNNNNVVDYYSQLSPSYPPEIMNTAVSVKARQRQYLLDGGEKGENERYADPITKGIFEEPDFQIITSIHEEQYGDWEMEILSDDDDDIGLPGSVQRPQRNSNSRSGDSVASSVNRDELAKMLVCTEYLKGRCTSTTCPLAHPGVREKAKIYQKAFRGADGKRTKVPFVYVCPYIETSLEDCKHGRNCKYYHIYIRPSTTDIILALYPINTGHKIKYFQSGAKYVGNVKNNLFHGYGVMQWPDGSIYLGDWMKNEKHGFGIYQTKDRTIEYIGQFEKGLRHGWGLLRNQLGDEYLGQWQHGKMCGVGVMKSFNGDIYRGQFENDHYNGIGLFQKSNGDVYMGYCKDGRAHGLGILSLRSGEKYKGYFDRNARHGKGACIYSNGCKYVGFWYRGVHQGFGIFISKEKEKYVGEWAGGKKHGNGRYYFQCGDFYDGQFFKNKAKGLGVYYYANGNLFTGEWDRDMKNGRGTYVFANGSKYTGNFFDNNIHGKGKFDFATGAFYRGHFDFNTKHGKGIYTWPNGNIYKGDFFREKLAGKGELIYAIGHRYVGEWANNKKDGYGVMYYSNGSIYEGNWKDDIRQGFGKLTLLPNSPVEESYEGDWDDDHWHGKGKYCYRKCEGTIYEGDWVYGIREGFGTLSYADGSFYRGEFKKDQMWGKGMFVDGVTNTQYDGEWRANMRQGEGTAYTVDAGIYHGEFFGNMKQGKGKLYNKDGSIYEGTWDANIIIGSGRMTIKVGDEKKRDGLPKQVTLKVFGY